MPDLTDRQIAVLDFIRSYSAAHGYAPSIREIGERLKISSPNGVMCHIKSLIKKGALKQSKQNGRGLARSITLAQANGSKPDITDIVSAVAAKFRTFGVGSSGPAVQGNPLASALADKPPVFALGVDVEEVVRFVLERVK